MTRRRSLSIYHLRNTVDGESIEQFEQALRDPGSLKSADPNPGLEFDFGARLFWSVSKLQSPTWLDLFVGAFDALPTEKVRRIDGVLLVRVEAGSGSHRFAFTFGQGRHLLKPGAIDRRYGLRVALNVIYERDGDELEPNRVRSVDSKVVAEDTINTRRQADRRTDFEAFEVDTNRDLLRAITGSPKESELWGARVSGGDSLSANPVVEFSDLGTFCRSIAQAHSEETYKEEFSWIDKLRAVSDAALLERLRELALQAIQQQGDVSVSVPDFIEWDEVEHFCFSFAQDVTFVDPEDSSPAEILEQSDINKPLSVDNARRWRLEAVSNAGEILNSWPLMRCIAGQLELDGITYVITDGDFFSIDGAFLAELDSFIGQIPESQHQLPQSPGDPPEGEYNELAASSDGSFLLLDKRTVRIANNTSPIEICDVLTSDGAFIHVKRKLGSSSLSHLFAQGSVSADLFLMSPEYREKTFAMVQEAEQDRADETGDNGFIGRFSRFSVDAIQPRNHEVVYAVVAKWRGRTAAQALPFFSKVNLRRHISDLRRMGYPVSFARIEVTEAG